MKKMRKCFICIIMTIALILSVTACSSDDDDIVQDGPGTKQEIDNNQSSNNSGKDSDKQNSDNGQKSDNTDTDAGQKNDVTDNTNSQDNNGSENSQGGNTAQNDDFSDLSKNIKMSVNGKTGDMTISRRSLPRQNSGDPEGWTIFVYLCATDLESKYGMGTGDLAEMLDAAASNKVRFVVQTGGTKQWQNQVIDTSKSQRYLVQNEDIQLVDEGKTVNMGDAESLKDFLVWGLDNYSSQHIGLILWNHGGGSITGVCFDETNDWDSLDLKDLDEALAGALNGTGKRFDFIGFDACLMGTIETANILTTYADYMYGSEETEPGSGWDYTEIGSYLASHPDADGAALGEVVANTYYAACEYEGDEMGATLSIIDLSKIDALLTSFNAFAKDMYEAGDNYDNRADMVRTISKVDNFGGNNKTEGYTNMVDLGGLIDSCSSYSNNAAAAKKALEDAVIYKVSGYMHEGASGLSTYYPLSVQGSEELSIFGNVCVSPYYLSFVDRQNSMGTGGSWETEYDDDTWFDDDDYWDWGYDDDDYEYWDDYWDYLDGYETTGESPFITFANEPGVDDDGIYWFELDDDGWYAAADVYAVVYQLSEDGQDIIEIGDTYDINGDWESGIFYDNFDGYWLSLPDGQNLATYIVDTTDEYILYTSPISLNGYDTNLRIRQYYDDGSVEIEGAWDGIDEYGAASREIIKLKAGDVILPLYNAMNLDTGEEFEYEGYDYYYTNDTEIYYDQMDIGEYYYAFNIDDIYGDYYLTDPITFYIDEDGEITFEFD